MPRSPASTSRPLTDTTRDAIAEALAQYGVLFFRDQDLSPDQQIALAENFGPIDVNRFFRPVDGHPQITEVRKEADQKAATRSHGIRPFL